MAQVYMRPNADGTATFSNDQGQFLTPEGAVNMPVEGTPSIGDRIGSAIGSTEDIAQKLASSFSYYYGLSADQYAAGNKAASMFGITPGTFQSALPETQEEAIKRAEELRNTTDWGTLVAQNPKTASYFSNYENMGQSHDDIAQFTTLEDIGNAISNSYKASKVTEELSSIYRNAEYKNQTMEDMSEEDRDRIDQLRANLKELQDKLPKSVWSAAGVASAITPFVTAFSDIGPDVQKGLVAGVGIGAGFGSAAGGIGAAPGAVAGGLVGIKAGVTYGLARYFGQQAEGMKYGEALEASKNVPGITTQRAKEGALVSGISTAILSSPLIFSLGKIAKLSKSTGLLKAMGLNTIEQSFLGGALAASDIMGSKVFTGAIGDWDGQDAQKIVKGGIDMIPVSVTMSLPGYGWAALHRMGQAVDATKTVKRNPDAVAEQVNNIMGDTPLQQTSFDAPHLYDTLNDMPAEDAKKVMDTLNIDPDTLSSKVATGGDIDVKTGNFLVMPESLRNQLLADAKLGGEPSARDMQERFEEAQAPQEEPLTYEGLKDNPEYQKAVTESEGKEPLSSEEIAQDAKDVEAQRSAIEQEVNSAPLYKAEDEFQMNLQLFGRKETKELAKQYRNDSLTDEQQAKFDEIAENNGYSSGDKLAQDILNNRVKDEEIKSRMDAVADEVKNQNGTSNTDVSVRRSINDAALKKTAMEANDMVRSLAEERPEVREKRTRQSTESILNDAGSVADEIVKLSKEDKLKNKISDLKERLTQANKELKYGARWGQAENKLITNIELGKLQVKNDKIINVLKDKIKDIKTEMKERVKDVKETDKQKMNERLDALQSKLDYTKKELKENIRWYQAESKDTREKQLARNSEYTVTAAKKKAKEEIQTRPVKESADYKGYFNLAQKAKREAERLYHKGLNSTDLSIRNGNFAESLKWKNKEVFNHAMAIEAIKVFRDFKKCERDLTAVRKAKMKSFPTEDDFNQVANLLNRFGMNRTDYRPESKRETLQQWSDRNSMTGNVVLDDFIMDESINKNYTDLTLDELHSLNDAIKNIKHVANFSGKTLKAERGEKLSDIRQALFDELDQKKTKYTNKKEARGKYNGPIFSLKNAWGSLKTMETFALNLSGEDGMFYKVFVRDRIKAQNEESKMVRTMQKQYEKLINDTFSKKERNQYSKKLIYIDDFKTELTHGELISLALNIGTEDNKYKLLSTRPTLLEDVPKWDEPTLMKVLGENLTSKDWKFIQGVWGLTNSLWQPLADHHRALTGFSPQKVPGTDVIVRTKDGKFLHTKGDYYPLKKDYAADRRSSSEMDISQPLYMSNNQYMYLTTKKGFTKTRTNAKYAISLDPNIFAQHVQDVIHDITHRGLLADYGRLFTNELRQAIFSKYGKGGEDLVNGYLQDLGQAPYRDVGLDSVNNMIRGMRTKAASAAIAFRLGVITQNFANISLYPGAAKGFGAADTAYGLLRYGLFDYWPRSLVDWRSDKRVTDQIYALSPFMADRANRPDYTLRELQSGTFGDKYSNPIQRFSVYLMQMTDNATAIPMWKTAYEKKLGETLDQQKAVEYADSLIRRSIGSPRRADQSAFMKAPPNTVTSVFNMFYSFMNTELNRWMREGNIASQSIKNTPRMMAFIASRMILFSMTSSFLSGNYDSDHPIASLVATGLSYPFSLIPIVKDVVPPAINAAFGLKAYSYRPGGVFNVVTSLGNTALKAKALIDEKPGKEGERQEQSFMENASRSLSYLTGYPDQFNAWFWNYYDYQNNGMEPQLGDILRRRPMAERKK